MKSAKHVKSGAWYCAVFFILFVMAVLYGCANGQDNDDPQDGSVDKKEIDAEEPPPYGEPPDDGEPHEEPIEGSLSRELERQILEDWAWSLWKPHDIIQNPSAIEVYYGTYNGAVAFMFEEECYVKQQTYISGIMFYSFSSVTVNVWKAGKFYTLREAYNYGLLTKENLESIAYRHNEKFIVSDEEIKESILEDWARLPVKLPDAPDSPSGIGVFYGKYGRSAVFMFEKREEYRVKKIIFIEGIKFYCYESSQAIVWREGKFYGLEEAYDLDLLTKSALGSIAVVHNGMFTISGELRRQIEEDIRSVSGYFHAAELERYYGTYNGYVVFGFDTAFDDLGRIIEVAGLEFWNGHNIFVWKEGLFYFLYEAYDSGLLTLEDVEMIYYLHTTLYDFP